MKSKLFLSMLFMGIFYSCFQSKDVKISVTDSKDEYQFSAYFSKAKTARIIRVIDENIAPTTISSDDDEIDVTTTLDDKTKFDMEYSPGQVIITLNKKENNEKSYERVKRMCGEIKRAIGEK